MKGKKLNKNEQIVIYIAAIIILKIITTIIILIKRNKENILQEYTTVEENNIHEIIVTDKPQYKEEIRPSVFVYPYHRVNLLTNAEWRFYQNLKRITDSFGYGILAKIRLADLISVNSGLSNSEWAKYFGKIKSKHIDFAIHKDMNIICLIELDDYTHQRRDRQERDEFVDTVLRQNGYAIIHTYGDARSLRDIEDFLNY